MGYQPTVQKEWRTSSQNRADLHLEMVNITT